jgi:hypothetical protein
MMWPMFIGCGLHCDTINHKRFELLAAKTILAEFCDMQTHQIDEIIWQQIAERQLLKREIKLYTDYWRPHIS